jgi:HEAT repeat protein
MPILKTISIVFPLLLPIWQERPLRNEDFNIPNPPILVETEDIQFAVDGFKYADPELKETIIRRLGMVDGTNARDALVQMLSAMEDATLKTAVLQALDGFRPLPKNAAVPVYKCLTHDVAEVRQAACYIIAYAPPSPQIATRLLELAANDPDHRVRLAALKAMAPNQVRTVEGERLLPFVSNTSSSIRSAAWEAFLSVENDGKPVPRTVLSSVAKDEAQIVRFTVARCLRPEHGSQAEEQLLTLAADRKSAVRVRAAETLAGFDGDDVQGRLLDLLEDADDEVRRVAVASLGKIAESATLPALVERLGDPSLFVRETTIETLIEMNSSISVSEAVASALNATNPDAREGACEVLGEVDAEPFAPAILNLVSTEERPSNLATAVKALGTLRWRGARATVVGLAAHTDTEVRRAVAFALGCIGDESTRETLVELVRDSESSVRVEAIFSTGRLGDASFVSLLLEVLDDARRKTPSFRPAGRMAAMWSLARILPLPNDAVKRIHGHITRPVIPTIMGPIFDTESVLVSGLFALAEIARRDPAAVSYFNSAQTLFSRELETGQAVSPSTLMPTPALREYARQGRALFEHGAGVTLEPTPVPVRKIRLPYRKR